MSSGVRLRVAANRLRCRPVGRTSSRSVSAVPSSASSMARRKASRSGFARPRAGGNRSITRPPPMVRRADWSRRISPSPCTAPMGRSSTICARPLSPGAMPVAPRMATRPVVSAAPRWTCTGVQCARARASDLRTRRRRSILCAGAGTSPVTTQSPRSIRSLSSPVPARLSAQRWPARPESVLAFWAWMPRMRTSMSAPRTRAASSACARPENAVPVTTSPAPTTSKLRSMASRKLPVTGRGGMSPAVSSRCAFSPSIPSPVMAETGKTGNPSSDVSANSNSMSSATSAARSALTRSILVSATAPRLTPSRSRMARCSSVWGIGPSSAATMNSTKSIPATPHSMLRINRSWPGTSIKPIVSAPSSGR